ncbi:MAG: Ig-like domain-containing protein [Gemmatimonadota bacterium]
MSFRSRWLLLAGASLPGCASDIVPPEPAPHVTITGGNEQSGAALDTLALPLEITVVDDEGKPVAGRTVSWSTGDVAARLVRQTPTTDADGRARAVWILGFESGAQSATANVAGEDTPAEFTASAGPVVGFKAIGIMEGSTYGSVGGEHMCALGVDSLAWCWGGNHAGKLGDGSTEASSLPRKVVGDCHFARIFGDPFNTCALTSSGELWCWGANGYTGPILRGVFGNGTTESSSVPSALPPGCCFAISTSNTGSPAA